MSRRVLGAVQMTAWVLGVAAGLGGCGSSEPDAGSGGKNAKSARPTEGSAHADMVSAVSSSKSVSPVQLHFLIPQAPVVGEPIDIQLVLTPTQDLEQVVARFQAQEGLEVIQGAETGRLEKPARGVDIPHTLTVKPKADGIYNIQAVILMDSETTSTARTFSIPIIAGAGAPDVPPPSADTQGRRPSGP